MDGENSSNSSRGSGNTKQIPCKKNWCFTLNNYSEKDIEDIKNLDSSKVPIITFQEEVGENGTPHLQGTISFKNKARPFGLGLNPKIHWEGTRKLEESREYCCKDDTKKEGGIRYLRGWEPNIPYVEHIPKEHWHPWMDEAKAILDGPISWDKVYWFWEPTGGVGKTSFCKWVFTHYPGVIILGGKAADMKYAITAYNKIHKRLPRIILVDIPRSIMDYVSYQGFEEVKQMCFFSGKYESDNIVGPRPHMMCFANEEPCYSGLSDRKWAVKRLHNNTCSS